MRVTLDQLETREWRVVARGDQKLFGILHRPTCCEMPPIAVIFHGFASSKHGSNRSYVRLAERLAKEGIATLRFDFRGSGDSDGELSDLSFEDLLQDGMAVLESLKNIDGVDSNRIALFGASLGGALAVLAASRFCQIKAPIKVMALWAPVASGAIWYRDFVTKYPQYLSVDPMQALSFYRGIHLHPLFREQFSQMNACKAMDQLVSIPVLMMQGERDETITMSHHEAYKEACQFRSNARFVHYADGEHTLGNSPYFQAVVEETLAWFQHYL